MTKRNTVVKKFHIISISVPLLSRFRASPFREVGADIEANRISFGIAALCSKND